mgnify:CR=1 FL=1
MFLIAFGDFCNFLRSITPLFFRFFLNSVHTVQSVRYSMYRCVQSVRYILYSLYRTHLYIPVHTVHQTWPKTATRLNPIINLESEVSKIINTTTTEGNLWRETCCIDVEHHLVNLEFYWFFRVLREHFETRFSRKFHIGGQKKVQSHVKQKQ